jgi:quercetin dioxygenase-like cupin family protein
MTSATGKVGCERAEMTSAYVLQALPANEVAVVESHIGTCFDCHQLVESLRRVVDSFAFWPTEVLRPSKPLWPRLAKRIGLEQRIGIEQGIAIEAGEEPALPAQWQWQEPKWEEVAPGIQCKLLATDTEKNRVSMLVRLAPGVEYPPHSHAGVEELHLLHGELWIDDRKLYPGDYNRAEPGTADKRVWSETGCACVLITSPQDVLG